MNEERVDTRAAPPDVGESVTLVSAGKAGMRGFHNRHGGVPRCKSSVCF